MPSAPLRGKVVFAVLPSEGYEVVGREDLSDVTYLLEVRYPELARAARAGQFVIVMSRPEGERIPLTIADSDLAGGTITLVVQAVGKTTREMQRQVRPGDHLFAVTGPMGRPSRIGEAKKVVCVGGGLGVAPMYPIARAFKEAGAFVVGVVGFRTKGLVFWEDRFRSVCDDFTICSDDGSVGIKGLVTVGIERALQRHAGIDEVVAVGPPVMMRAVAELTRPLGIRTVVSLNPIMVDGTGMCGGCRVQVGGKTLFACVDGPEFDGHQVDFDDLFLRLRRFQPDEKLALDHWQAAELTPAAAE